MRKSFIASVPDCPLHIGRTGLRISYQSMEIILMVPSTLAFVN